MPDVATSILKNDEGKILILKRSDKVSTYKGSWSGIAGYVEENETPLETALKEICEEVGITEDNVELIKRIDPIEFTDIYEGKKYDWRVFPFLFSTLKKSKIKIDWEHTDYKWIAPSDIKNYDTVPHIKRVVLELLM
jgi:8-oxo-dGTP pyrophosphatase MutT (NUDIX family)